MLAIVFPTINPIFLSIGSVEIRWYGIAYAVSIISCYLLLKRLYPKTQENTRLLDDIMFFCAIGMISGGRIGYVLFYHTEWLWRDSMRILQIWLGGMSFHGGLIGVVLAVYLASLKHHRSFLHNCDNLAYVTPIGLFFGRIANFINGELWGRVTDVPWAIILADGSVRHPSQLYEAVMEGIVLLIIMIVCHKKLIDKPGAMSGLFLICYGLFRMIIENFREPDEHVGLCFGFITRGQILSAPMMLLGVYLLLVRASITNTNARY